MITKADIFNKITFFLKEETRFFTSATLNTMIGRDVFRRIAEDIDYPKTNFSTFLTSGQWEVSAPTDFLKVDENSDITFQTSISTTSGTIQTFAKLLPMKQKDIGRDNILNVKPGMPQNYFFETEQVLAIYPPSMSGCLVVPYVQQPTMLSSDTDTNQLTEQAYMAAAYWVVSECYLRDNDQRQGTFLALYDKEILRLRKRFGERMEIDYDLKPADAYLNRQQR